MRVVFRPEARAEALEARAWYDSRAAGLGLEFARALDAAIFATMRHPDGHPEIGAGCRQAILRKFPYSLVYRVRGDELLVVAVFHHRRDPDRLAQRVGR
ncbi:MAG: type II toxin-antitoxin system RelE/ParE family toxin [Proteobacteria bacterium]|nr:type II toxin-antitoxin system RelE/ParE family toxin [Pseudomonadota bacterium]